MRRRVILGWFVVMTLVGWVNLAQAQVSVDLGFHFGSAPKFVEVPSSPVMYAPSVAGNYFFYAGNYYVFKKGHWYTGTHHSGPWALVEPEFVPRPILAVPVHYYRVPPAEWKRWHAEAAPRWEPAYGRRWEEREHRAVIREERHEEGRR
jgi:hypothetical protein